MTTALELIHGDPDCQYKHFTAKVGEPINPDADVDIECFMSTDSVDSDDEVMLPNGIDLSRYAKNPVVMLCHAMGQPGCFYPLPVGKALWTKQVKRGVLAGVRFARDTEMGRQVKSLFDEGMLRSFSVGFRPLEASGMTRKEAESRPDWQEAYERTKGQVRVHRKWSLIELSVAPIPSNPDALVTTYKAKGILVPSWLNLKSKGTKTMPDADYEEMVKAAQETAKTIKHGPDYGDMFAHKGDAALHWTMADGDGGDGMDTSKTIKEKLASVPGCKKVQIGDEWSPREEEGWVHIYPQSHGTKSASCECGKAPCECEKPVETKAEDEEVPPEADPDDFDEEDETALPIKTRDHVDIKSKGFHGCGMVEKIHRKGMVDHVDEDMIGTKDDPAARVRLYRAHGDGHKPSETRVAAKLKSLTRRAEPFKEPSKKSVEATPEVETKAASAGPLPPLVCLSDTEIAQKALAQINDIPALVQREIARITGVV